MKLANWAQTLKGTDGFCVKAFAEALEIIVHGDKKTSKVIDRRVDEIELPREAFLGAIVRKTKKSKEEEKTGNLITNLEIGIMTHIL